MWQNMAKCKKNMTKHDKMGQNLTNVTKHYKRWQSETNMTKCDKKRQNLTNIIKHNKFEKTWQVWKNATSLTNVSSVTKCYNCEKTR